MPITGHWDLASLNDVAGELIKNGFLTQTHYYRDIIIYPPLTYFTLAFWQILIKPVVFSDFYSWLVTPILETFYNPHTFRYFFLLKIPHLLFDLGILFLLLKFFKDETEDKQKLAVVLWAFNPVVLYATFAWGAIDIIPTFFLLLSVVLLKYQKPWFALPMLGIGGGFKIFPLLFIVPAALVAFKSWKKRILGLLVGILPFLLVIFPYLSNPGFRRNIFESDRGMMIYAASFHIGIVKFIYLFFVFYTFLSLWISKYGKSDKLWKYILIILLFFYATVAFTPQWFVWGTPFFIIHFLKYKNLRINYLWIFIGYLLIVLSFDATLSLGLLSPIEPTFWIVSVFKEYLEQFLTESNKVWSVFHSFLAGSILWLSYSWWRLKKNEQNS